MMFSKPHALPVELMGPLGAFGASNANVEALQTALRNLSVATGRPDFSPGATNTGVVDAATIAAVVASMGLLTEKLDSWQYLTIQAALVAGTATSKAKEIITTYAPQLTIAANTAAVKFKTQPVVVPTPTIVGFFAPGWYKTPLGMGLIAVAALVIYKFVLKPTPAAAK